MALGFRLAGLAFLPLVASLLAMVFNVVVRVRLQMDAPPGLTHLATFGSLVLVGVLSYRWTRRPSVAIVTLAASVLVTGLALFLLLLWALSSVWG